MRSGRIIEEAAASGNVTGTAKRHGIQAQQIYHWRERLFGPSEPAGFLPVSIAADPSLCLPAPVLEGDCRDEAPAPVLDGTADRIEIVAANGVTVQLPPGSAVPLVVACGNRGGELRGCPHGLRRCPSVWIDDSATVHLAADVAGWARQGRRSGNGSLLRGEPVSETASADPAPVQRPRARRGASGAGTIKVEIDGVTVRVGRGADARTVTAVLHALKASS